MAAPQHRRSRDPRPQPGRRVALALVIAMVAGEAAHASARPASTFKVVARNQDELGVWHVTALLPQLVSSNGKPAMETGSVLARVDCRQHVLSIDAWSLRASAAEAAEGWRPPADAREQALLEAVCRPAPQLRERAQALISPSTDRGAARASQPSPERSPAGRPRPSPRFAAQIGLFTSKAAADRALAKASSHMTDPSRLKPLTVPLPGKAPIFRALLAAPTIEAAREICTAERRVAVGSTCWVRPIHP